MAFEEFDAEIEAATRAVVAATLTVRDMKFCIAQNVLTLRHPMVVDAEEQLTAARSFLQMAHEARERAEQEARSNSLAARRERVEALLRETRPELFADLEAAVAAVEANRMDPDGDLARRAHYRMTDAKRALQDAFKMALDTEPIIA